MTPADIVAALVRTTLAASAAALAAWALLAWLRIDSPRIHRIAWLLVIAQGWLFIPLTIEVETASPLPTRRAAGLVPAVIHEAEPIPFENEPQWGRGHFATGDSPIVNNPLSQKVPDPFSLAIAAWLLGATALVAISVYRYMQVLRTLPLGSPPDEPTWQAEWHAARAAAKLRRRQTVDLRVTTALGPLLHWAPWSYLILVPRTLWATLAAPERQAILRHELAHLRRDDLWKSLAIRVLALPQWFNPLAWLAVRRFDEAAEWACDDAAAATIDSRLTFAESLLQSAEYAVAPFPASASAARGVLTRRIHRLVNPRFKEESKMKLLVPPLLLLLLAMFQTLRIERVAADETPQQPSRSDKWSLAEQFKVPLGERLKHAEQQHAKLLLLAERQRQLDFDRLTKEFEDFARKDYVIEPPDILRIEGVKLVPKAPHRLETFDELQIRATGALTDQPIDNVYNVDADGAVNLGPTYGRINVVGQTIKQAEGAIRAQLVTVLGDADVSVSLRASSSAQAITGQHLVAMDGRVNLGVYGTVYVTGMTLKEARAAIELKLTDQLDDPKVSVDVLAYNSKVYYVITQGGAHGDDVTRLPIPYPVDGRENVAEALARVYDNADRTLKLKELADASLTLARPAPNGVGLERAYPIVWDASTQAPSPNSNHGILPGDRIFVKVKREGKSPSDVPKKSRPAPPPAAFVPHSLNFYTASEAPSAKAGIIVNEAYLLQPYDTVKLRVARPHRPAHALTWGDIEGEFTVDRNGAIEFGSDVEIVAVAGLTVEEARAALERQLRKESPDCEVQLSFVTLAAEKYVISVQRSNGTEIVTGALLAGRLSEATFFEFSQFVRELGPDVQFNLSPAKSRGLRDGVVKLSTVWDAVLPPRMPATDLAANPGDRLIITVADDYQPRFLPLWMTLCDVAGRPGYRRAPMPRWSPVFNTKFDHPDVQRPAPYFSR